MIIGMDFGTTNTGAAAYDGRDIRLLPLDPSASTPSICRTAIYITRSRDYYLGSSALNLYFNQNVGRPTRYRKVKVGEIVQVFAELPTFYRDVFIYEDEFSPGRLFLSIKTALRNPNYYGTVFLENWYSASDLAAIFLIGMRRQAEKALGEPVREVVLGRPVHFSTNPDEDKVAQSRLLDGAFKAGFEKVYLEYEPVAAALSYERNTKGEQTILVFDFGGGTLDFTVMQVGGSQRRVLATGGIPVAGDVFDQRLFRATIPPHLGENGYFLSGGRRYPIPAHIFDLLSSPQEVLSLNTPENLDMLRSIHAGAIHKEKTHALLKIVSSNYALLMFDLIERAKRQLSDDVGTNFVFKTDDFELEELMTRIRFERAIQRDAQAVREGLLQVLDRAGLRARDIDRVIRTGGSSQIPLFVRMLNEMFGRDRVQAIDTFSSVTAGLSIRGREVEAGLAELPAYTPASIHISEEIGASPASHRGVDEIDLAQVKKRMEVVREYHEGQARLPQTAALVLGKRGLRLFPVEGMEENSLAGRLSGAIEADLSPEARAALAPLDGQVLLATNGFKLINASVQALYVAQEASTSGVGDLLRLEANEAVTAILPWEPSNPCGRYVCMVTRSGQARSFDARLLAEQVTQKPYFQLEKRYTANPVFLLPLDEAGLLLVGSSSGRAGRTTTTETTVMAYDVLKTRAGEEVTAAACVPAAEDGPVLALNDGGTLLLFSPAGLLSGGPPASRGLALRRSFRILAFLSPEAPAPLALTSQARLLRLSYGSQAGVSAHLKTVRLKAGEKIIACVQPVADPSPAYSGSE